KKTIPDWEAKLAQWAETDKTKWDANAWKGLHPHSAEVPDGICHPEVLPDGSVLNLGFRPTSTKLTVIADTDQKDVTGLLLDALTHGDLIFTGPGRSRVGCFAISEIKVDAASLDSPDKFEYVPLSKATSDVAIEEGLIQSFFRHTKDDRRMVGGGRFLTDDDLKTAWSPDRGPRWRNGDSHAVLQFGKPVTHSAGTRFKIAMGFRHGGADAHGRRNNFLGRFRLSTTSKPLPEAAPWPSEVRVALAKPVQQRTDDDRSALLRQWGRSVKEAKTFVDQIDRLWAKWPEGDSVLNLAARTEAHRRKTHILLRGNWQDRGAEVLPGVPAFLHALPADAPPNRLTLANWLVDRKSPTTARVVVNRIWQAYFGTGLVETAEDFGVRVEAPSHPQLLDWLALELMEPSLQTSAEKQTPPWSLKHLHRVIVSSATYQQSAATSPALAKSDPRNRLLARGPRFRADAEVVRDIALTASGLLSRKTGGPSVFPPVPEGFFAISFVDVDFWETATGPDRYRRSLYVFRRRSIPDPVMASFDAPRGDSSCVRRMRSNTPLAALTMLNETVFTEAAQALSLRILRDAGSTDTERVTYGFRLCTGRVPNDAELAEILRLAEGRRARLASGELKAADIAFNEFSKPADLPASATPNDAAVWTIVARVLLNLDATVTKG
ncbi:MAG TPA: DUF1553 domain-containing protein, partial [Pirellulales bacterium]|nr:DUF1553 domain-containing protein [Pirellulales bacterium]